MSNPYYNLDFFGVLLLFFQRMPQWILQGLDSSTLATDEIQILVLTFLGISSALTGSFLVLKKMAMLANSISHTVLLGIIPAFLLSASVELNLTALLISALLAALMTAFFTEALTKWTRLQEDASTGIIFTSLFALGIILATLLTRSSHVGAEAVMGNADALHWHDVKGSFVILVANLTLVALFFRQWQLISFDPNYAKMLGIPVAAFNYLLLFMASVTLVGSFRAVGVLMVLTFITAPALLARLYCKSLAPLLIFSSAVAFLCSLFGVALTRHLLTTQDLALSTGGLVVTLIGGLYLLCLAIFRILSWKFDFFRKER